MKKGILAAFAMLIVIPMTIVRASEPTLDFDGTNFGKGVLQSRIIPGLTLETEILVPTPLLQMEPLESNDVGNRELFGGSAFLQNPKIYFIIPQKRVKEKLLEHFSDKFEHVNHVSILKDESTFVLFDSEKIYLATKDFEIVAEFADRDYVAASLLSVNANSRKKVCKPGKELLRKCGKWGQYGCLVWEVVEHIITICEEIPDTNDFPSTPGGGSGGTYTNGQGGSSPYDVNKKAK